ncbi:MAG: hypothetical protein QM737_22680 [Ferruginibacter sp.]
MPDEEKKPHRWVEGQPSANPYGRPKGSKNKRRDVTRHMLYTVLGKLSSKILSDIDSLKPAERVRAFLQVATFFAPKEVADKIEENADSSVKVIIKYEEKPEQTKGDYEQLDYPDHD